MGPYNAVPPPAGLGDTTASLDLPIRQQLRSGGILTTSPSHRCVDAGVEAWNHHVQTSLGTCSCGISAPPSIPLHERMEPIESATIAPPPGPASRRDSLRQREAVLKGREGTRQRRRWENDRLAGVPNLQPPQPQDWAPQPTYPVHHVPYGLAATWDLRMRAEVETKKTAAALRQQRQTRTQGDANVAGRIPRELCQRAKRVPALRSWVRSLEEPVRQFLVECGAAKEGEDESDDTEDEEIVFVGRNGQMREGCKKARRMIQSEKAETGLVIDALGEDEGSTFKRWLTHSISDYYGLASRSALIGNPGRKVIYVGIKETKTNRDHPLRVNLPRPLWQLC